MLHDGIVMQQDAATKNPPVTKYRLASDKAAVIRTNPPHNMSVMEGAAYLGVSPRKLRDLIAARRIKYARVGSKIILRREWCDEMLGAGT